MSTIYLAGGCFWGLQKFFDQFDGVINTEVGYANGPEQAPSYEDVCHDSGHAETVKIVYDEKKIPLENLLDYYFMVIDPPSSTQKKAKGRSLRPYTHARRKRQEQNSRLQLNRSGTSFRQKLTTRNILKKIPAGIATSLRSIIPLEMDTNKTRLRVFSDLTFKKYIPGYVPQENKIASPRKESYIYRI